MAYVGIGGWQQDVYNMAAQAAIKAGLPLPPAPPGVVPYGAVEPGASAPPPPVSLSEDPQMWLYGAAAVALAYFLVIKKK
jgi:hypothetical protein